MPPAPKRECTQPGCRVLTTTGRCEAHKREAWAKREDAPKRITGRKLQGMRARLFAAHPLCVECERHGRVTVATERDHVVPLFMGGADDETNQQGLCAPCHEAKSIREKGQTPRARIGADGWPARENP